MRDSWEQGWIIIPAGVKMTRRNGSHRTFPTSLQCRAKRRIDEKGKPIDNFWEFPWLSVAYTVLQSEVELKETK